MQIGTSEEWTEIHHHVAVLTAGIQRLTETIERHTTASTFALVFLMQELEARGGIDRAALADQTIAGLRLAQPDVDAETDRAVRDLFGQSEGRALRGPSRPGLRVIDGGKG